MRDDSAPFSVLLLGFWLGVACGTPPAHQAEPSTHQAASMADTSRPPVPATWIEQLDTTLTVTSPSNPAVRYWRTRFLVAFDSAARGPAVRTVLRRYGASIVGGLPSYGATGAYIVAVPDMGPDWTKWKALEDSLNAEPAVSAALSLDVGMPLQSSR
jgi:hypothetical protein